jgi:hypothetical protein
LPSSFEAGGAITLFQCGEYASVIGIVSEILGVVSQLRTEQGRKWLRLGVFTVNAFLVAVYFLCLGASALAPEGHHADPETLTTIAILPGAIVYLCDGQASHVDQRPKPALAPSIFRAAPLASDGKGMLHYPGCLGAETQPHA